VQPRLPPLNSRPLSQRAARIGGVFLILIGLILLTITGLLFGYFLDLVQVEKLIPGVYRDPEAEKSVPIAAWLFVGFFSVFALVSIFQGFWQIVYGVRNRIATALMIFMGALFIAAGVLARALK
jgi:hypothetical protein